MSSDDLIQDNMTSSSYADILQRIQAALGRCPRCLRRVSLPARLQTEYKVGHDPVTEADRAVDAVLRQNLLRDGEGWLSEESVDDPSRLGKSRVWVVDPLDGTREFVAGIPEFCVSIGFVEDGRPVAGGICNPATNETFIGSIDSGVLYNGKPARPSQRTTLKGALILASRSEVKRGEWQQFQSGDFQIRPMGSVAYKLASGRRRSGRHHFHADAEKRMGRRRRRRPGAKRWRICRHARQDAAAL